MQNPSEFLEFAIKTARLAGDNILMRDYGRILNLEWKDRVEFKTKIDDESDKFIRKEISEHFPDHNIISEETRDKNTRSQYSWVVDPLDGTIPFTYGFTDHFSVCIGLTREKLPVELRFFLP